MFTRKTTLVLGAGASKPYHYPVGAELRNEITSGNKWVSRLHPNFIPSTKPISKFRELFRDSRIPSIDFFLAQRENEQWVKLGKMAIAAILLECESDWEQPAGDWYDLLFTALTSPAEGAKERLRIVTFNYDRSLEHYLHRAYKALYSLNNVNATARMREDVEILHVYGSLGPLADIDQADPGATPFGKGIDYFVNAAEGIHVVGRSEGAEKNFERARAMIAEAEFVGFIGFAFLPENASRLGLESSGRCYFASAFGMTDGAVYTLKRSVDQAMWLFGGRDQTGYDYLRESDLFGLACRTTIPVDQAIRHLSRARGMR